MSNHKFTENWTMLRLTQLLEFEGFLLSDETLTFCKINPMLSICIEVQQFVYKCVYA